MCKPSQVSGRNDVHCGAKIGLETLLRADSRVRSVTWGICQQTTMTAVLVALALALLLAGLPRLPQSAVLVHEVLFALAHHAVDPATTLTDFMQRPRLRTKPTTA